MTSILYFNSPLETLVRGAVRLPNVQLRFLNLKIHDRETDFGIGFSRCSKLL